MAATLTTFGDSDFCRHIIERSDITQFLRTKSLTKSNAKRDLEAELQVIVVEAALSLRSQMELNCQQISREHFPTVASLRRFVGGAWEKKDRYEKDLYAPQVLRLGVKALVDHCRKHGKMKKREIENVLKSVMTKVYPNLDGKCVGCVLNAQIRSRIKATPSVVADQLFCPRCSTKKKAKKKAKKKVEKPMDLSINERAYKQRHELCINPKKHPRFYWKDNHMMQENEDYVMVAASIAVPYKVEELNKAQTNVEFFFKDKGRQLWDSLCKVFPNKISPEQHDELDTAVAKTMQLGAPPLLC